jgi:hypothetical protein
MIPTESGKASWYQSPEISERLVKGMSDFNSRGKKNSKDYKPRNHVRDS